VHGCLRRREGSYFLVPWVIQLSDGAGHYSILAVESIGDRVERETRTPQQRYQEHRLYWARTGGADEARTCCGGQEVVAMTQSWLLEAMKCAERVERGGN